MKYKKIFITSIITTILLFTIATLTLDWNSSVDDNKIITRISGIEATRTESERMERADLVIVGNVIDTQIREEKHNPASRWNMVFTYLEITPDIIIKGTPIINERGNIIVKTPGGETENYRTEDESLLFETGDRVSMHLGHHKNGIQYIPFSVFTTFIIEDGMVNDYYRTLSIEMGLLEEYYAASSSNVTLGEYFNPMTEDELVQYHKDLLSEL